MPHVSSGVVIIGLWDGGRSMIDHYRKVFLALFAAMALGLGVAACDDGGSGDNGASDSGTTSDDSGSSTDSSGSSS